MDTAEFQQQPWFSNNDYLERFLDSIGYPPAGSGNRIVGAPVRFWIPIKFWIYRDDNGIGGPTLPQIQNLMDNLNRRFNQTNNAMIGFYMKCDPTYIDNSNNNTKTFTGASILMAANNDAASFNVHIIANFASANTAGFSIPFLNASMIPSGSYLQGRANGDLAHEIGHLLGLAHTHQYSAWNWKCLTESVSRTRTWPTFNLCPTRLISNRVCEATGDALRDTQADDNLVSNNACFYNVSFGNDEWGDSYDNPPTGLQDRPNIRNIMSYNSATDCVDQFSRLQIGVMLYTLYFKKGINTFGWGNSIYTFDDFEPDNESITAREIILNQVQERNFHQQYNRSAGNTYATQCDVDWVRFTPTCNMSYEVQTSAITGRTNANTRLTIFDANLTQLAQNDDISSSNQFSEITINLTAGQTYLFKIENMSANVTGYYSLKVSPSFTINGDNNFCTTSNNYTITNLPTGATVQWTAAPAGMVTINSPNSPQTTLTKLANGTITLTATITNACGNGIVSNPKENIIVGSIPVTEINISLPLANPDNLECNTIYKANGSVSSSYQPTGYQWTINPEWTIINNPANASINFAPNANASADGYLGLSVQNGCGWSAEQVLFMHVSCNNGYSMAISPNPAQDFVTISSTSNNSKVAKANSQSLIYKIKITDAAGVIRGSYEYQAGIKSTRVSLTNLNSGLYLVSVFDGKNWVTKTIIKK